MNEVYSLCTNNSIKQVEIRVTYVLRRMVSELNYTDDSEQRGNACMLLFVFHFIFPIFTINLYIFLHSDWIFNEFWFSSSICVDNRDFDTHFSSIFIDIWESLPNDIFCDVFYDLVFYINILLMKLYLNIVIINHNFIWNFF